MSPGDVPGGAVVELGTGGGLGAPVGTAVGASVGADVGGDVGSGVGCGNAPPSHHDPEHARQFPADSAHQSDGDAKAVG